MDKSILDQYIDLHTDGIGGEAKENAPSYPEFRAQRLQEYGVTNITPPPPPAPKTMPGLTEDEKVEALYSQFMKEFPEPSEWDGVLSNMDQNGMGYQAKLLRRRLDKDKRALSRDAEWSQQDTNKTNAQRNIFSGGDNPYSIPQNPAMMAR